MLNIADISPKKTNGIDTQVAAIQGDIARLEHRLKIPANFRGLVTGTTVGMY